MQAARSMLPLLAQPALVEAAAAAVASTSGRPAAAFAAHRGRFAGFQSGAAAAAAAAEEPPSSAAAAEAGGAAAAAPAAPAAPEPSGSGRKKAPKGGGGAAGRGAPDPAALEAQLRQLKADYRRSRMLDFYERILARELLLKLNVKSVTELPRVEKVNLAIQAKDAAGGAYVDKWQLLLQALALEIATGEPATFARPASRYYQQRNAVTGVHVPLSGAAAHDALEKIAYLLLPSQNAFEGLLARQIDKGGGMHFKIASMVNLPDFEEMFETFETLRALDVNITMRGVAKRPGRTQLLLTGLQLPVMARKHQIGGAAPGGGGGEGGGEGGGA